MGEAFSRFASYNNIPLSGSVLVFRVFYRIQQLLSLFCLFETKATRFISRIRIKMHATKTKFLAHSSGSCNVHNKKLMRIYTFTVLLWKKVQNFSILWLFWLVFICSFRRWWCAYSQSDHFYRLNQIENTELYSHFTYCVADFNNYHGRVCQQNTHTVSHIY